MAEDAVEPEPEDHDLKILARDRKKGKPLLSRLDWSEKAIERVLAGYPAGFMRDRTQTRDRGARRRRACTRRRSDFELVEEGIAFGLEADEADDRQTYGGASPEMKDHDEAAKADGGSEAQAQKCPAAASPVEAVGATPASPEAGNGKGTAGRGNGAGEGRKLALNEVSVISEMEKRRRELEAEADSTGTA